MYNIFAYTDFGMKSRSLKKISMEKNGAREESINSGYKERSILLVYQRESRKTFSLNNN